MPNFRPLRMWTLAAAACALIVAHGATAAVTWTKFLGGFAQPVDIANAGDGSGRLFVAQQKGAHPRRAGRHRAGNAVPRPPALTAATASRAARHGVPSALRHATAASIVNYTRAGDGATVIARYRVCARPRHRRPGVGRGPADDRAALRQPQRRRAQLRPDGYLYIGMGDGGGGNDPEARAGPATLLGKMLRIDVEPAARRTRFRRQSVGERRRRPAEIWAIGLRNPWRFSFDRATGDFWIGDVGQDARRGDRLLAAGTGAGANFGWRVMEGTRCTGLSGPVACNAAALTWPVLPYTHNLGAR